MQEPNLPNVAQEEQLTPNQILALQREANEMSPDDLKATGMYVQAAVDSSGEEDNLEPVKLTRQQRRAHERQYKKIEEQWGKIQGNKKLKNNLSAKQQERIYQTFLNKMIAMNHDFDELRKSDEAKQENTQQEKNA